MVRRLFEPPARLSSSLRMIRSMGINRSVSEIILSKMRRWESRNKSSRRSNSIAWLQTALSSRIAPRIERSASTLDGRPRSRKGSPIAALVIREPVR